VPEYINPPIKTDLREVMLTVFDEIQAKYPNWRPIDANPDVVALTVLCQRIVESGDVSTRVARGIFRWYGLYIVGVPPIDAAPARASTTWTFRDASGPYTVFAGQPMFLTRPDGTTAFFELDQDITVEAGEVSLSGVSVTSTVDGPQDNDLTGALALSPGLSYVQSVSISGSSGGGSDAETDDVYLGRLIGLLATTGPRPIRAQDFATFARNFPEVFRAVAIDNFIPANSPLGNTEDLFEQERASALTLLRENGDPVSETTKTAVAAYFEQIRLLNFIVSLVDATYTEIDVEFEFTRWPPYDASGTAARAEESVRAYLNKATWGTTPYGDPASAARTFEVQRTIDAYELATVINNTQGVDKVVPGSLRFGIAGTALGSDTVLLPGSVPIATAGSVTGVAV
jgi:hypothetical protein